MKKLFVPSLILAILLAAAWEAIIHYESNHSGLVVYGYLAQMKVEKQAQVGNQWMGTQPENKLVVMQFAGKPNALRDPEFYTAKLIDTTGAIHKIQTAVWDEKMGGNYLVFAVPEKAEIAAFQYSDQPTFPIDHFRKFAWLRFRNILGIATLTMIALAIIFGIVKHFKQDDQTEEHVDPFDYINKNNAP